MNHEIRREFRIGNVFRAARLHGHAAAVETGGIDALSCGEQLLRIGFEAGDAQLGLLREFARQRRRCPGR